MCIRDSFQNHACPCCAYQLSRKHGLQRSLRLCPFPANHNPFARRESVRLDYYRIRKLIQCPARLFQAGSRHKAGGRNPGTLHELLGEDLAPFKPCCRLRGAKEKNSFFGKEIRNPIHQRCLWAGQHQVSTAKSGGLHKIYRSSGSNGNALGHLAATRIPRRHEDF